MRHAVGFLVYALEAVALSMSLTSELDDGSSWIRRHFAEHFPGLRDVVAELRGQPTATPEHQALEASSPPTDYGFVGTAFEIRVAAARRVIDWASCLSSVGFRIADGMSPKRTVLTTLRPSFAEATRLLTTSPPGRQAVLCWADLRLETLPRLNSYAAQMLLDRANSIIGDQVGWLDIPAHWIADVSRLAEAHFRLRAERPVACVRTR